MLSIHITTLRKIIVWIIGNIKPTLPGSSGWMYDLHSFRRKLVGILVLKKQPKTKMPRRTWTLNPQSSRVGAPCISSLIVHTHQCHCMIRNAIYLYNRTQQDEITAFSLLHRNIKTSKSALQLQRRDPPTNIAPCPPDPLLDSFSQRVRNSL